MARRTRVRIIFFVLTLVVLSLTLLFSGQIGGYHKIILFEIGYSNVKEGKIFNETLVSDTKCSEVNCRLNVTIPKALTKDVAQIDNMNSTLLVNKSSSKSFLKNNKNISSAIQSLSSIVDISQTIAKKVPKKVEIASKTAPAMHLVTTRRTELKFNKYPGFIPVSWTTVGGRAEIDSFQLFSAYYDNRNFYNGTAAVLVLGYALNQVQKRPLYCEFKYEGGETDCVNTPLVMESISSCYTANLGGEPYSFICNAGHRHHTPLTVRISDSSACTSQFTSDEILVRNRFINHSVVNDFGVCVGGPLIEQVTTLQDVIEFISMSQILGAKLITIYVSLEQVKASIVEYLLTRYPEILRLIEWKKFKKWYPLHYYGQYLLIHDCLYRSMYEVNYLFMLDIDEMFIPAENSWSEMVKRLPCPLKGVGFRFQNFFFSSSLQTTQVITEPKNPHKNYCDNIEIPKYLTHTLRHVCFPGHKYRTKLMVRPSFVVDMAVHWVCRVLDGYNNSVDVPTSLGFLGHFRTSIPKDCLDHEEKPARENLWAAKYSNILQEKICCTKDNNCASQNRATSFV